MKNKFTNILKQELDENLQTGLKSIEMRLIKNRFQQRIATENLYERVIH